MYRDIRTLNVFLASPGDLGEERHRAKRAVEEVNLSVGRQISWRVEFFGWEDTTPGFFRPQSKINEDVDRCDLFVGMLWKRWGQPPGDSKYESGFEEEYERAKDRRGRDGRPEIWLFLKSIDQEALQDPGEGLKRVLAFRSKLLTDKRLMFKEFQTPDDWERQFRVHLSQHLLNLWRGSIPVEAGLPTISPEKRIGQYESSPPREVEKPAVTEKHSREIADSFKHVLDLIKKGPLGFDGAEISSHDLARLTTLASTLFALRFSDELLGVHQANLLYTMRDQVSLTQQEWLFVVRSSIGSAANLIPGWYWIRPSVKSGDFIIGRATRDYASQVRAGAIRLVRELSITLSAKQKERLLQTTSELADENTTKQVLRLLKERGTSGDLWFTNEIEEGSQHSLKGDAEAATAAILAREQPRAILERIIANGKGVGISIVVEVASKIETDALKAAATNKRVEVRKFAAQALNHLGKIDKELAATLISDTDPSIRKIGIRAALDYGEVVDPKTIRQGLSPDSLLGALGGSTETADDLIVKSLGNLGTSDLEGKIGWNSPDGYLAYKALGVFHFSDFAGRIRADLADNFERHRLAAETELLSRLGEGAKHTIEEYQSKGLNDFLRRKFLNSAIAALAKNGDKQDEQAIRYYASTDDNDVAMMVADYLGRFGSSADARPLLGMADKLWRRTDEIVTIAYRLSDDPKVLVLDSSLSDRIRTKILAKLDDKQFLDLRAHWIPFLNAENSDMRRWCAYKLYHVTKPKQRKALLDEYVSQSTYYYDVVFWLDRLAYAARPWQERFLSSLRDQLEHPFSDL